ncbi:gliding motility-associated ABC transporter substrate-binding protein GldG [Chitinophaga horti]|uniref:Gliding motility-associated ABC transporter substrate-binding protein GldG n=1 Tax=Chitinophaga horti TaxID=2920382 RepID=A0ABY6J4U9_9BACT|nr:gliding motility-associated ABC transporter substrate-binding protein GldG [Chitinophaga horti]UYQ93204.1 gliding motility-associated ABC transporter substrate-binding protein GldG [Chitinophaga horti]
MEVTTRHKRKQYIQRVLLVLLVLIGINTAASFLHRRWDLTAEKRYTLTGSTKMLLRGLDAPLEIDVFLKGDYPAGFRQLAQNTQELLEEFSEYGGNNVRFRFITPGAELPDSLRFIFQDSLVQKGIMPFNLQVQSDASDGISEKLIFPGALVRYKGKEIGVTLLQGQPGTDPAQALNSSAAMLEYRFANAIYQLSLKEKPLVGYMLGHGEPVGTHVYDALTTLQSYYRLDTINLKLNPFIPREFGTIIFLKPIEAFTEEDKLKIDQYVMNGGKVIWFLNNLTTDMDSLQASGNFVAMSRGLELEDLLFRYGARVNQDLIQDLQSDVLPIIVGSMGDKPQIQYMPFIYFPKFSSTGSHPIVKNMDAVLGRFTNSIDTVTGGGIQKTILLASSARSRKVSSPVGISLDELKRKPNPRQFMPGNIPAAVLLEGNFTSLFNHRLNGRQLEVLQQLSGVPYRSVTAAPNKMIVVADADIVTNFFSEKNGPLQMGANRFTQEVFANKEFFTNCMEYLTNTSGIMETRNRELTLRLLDGEKVKQQHTKWQLLAFVVPIGLVLIFAMVFNFLRQRRFTA